LTKTKS